MKNINTAFKEFQKDYTSIEPDTSRLAKASRNWLLDRVGDFNGDDFPVLYDKINMPFGSFARKTKIPALDDIDLLVGIDGTGCKYDSNAPWDNITIRIGNQRDDLLDLCHDGTVLLNSRKVINRFVNRLEDVPHYSKADIHRNGEACTLKLTSYTWNFDIVPCFFTAPETSGRTYYVIPNADGNWMKTDPRIDKRRIEHIDGANGGHVIPTLRIIKYWQRRATMPSISSYLLETMLLNYFERNSISGGMFWPDIYLPGIFQYISSAIMQPVADPKALVADINDTSLYDRQRIAQKASDDYRLALQARKCEEAGDMEGCFKAWGQIFGPSFPSYN